MCADVASAEDEGLFAAVVFYAMSGLAAVTIGAWLSARRPANGTGTLLAVLGLAQLLGASANLADAQAALPGRLLSTLAFPALLHVVVAFPSGVLHSRVDRAVVIVTYAINVATSIMAYIFTAPPGLPLTAGRGGDVAADLEQLSAWALQAIIAAMVLRLVVRWRRWRPEPGRTAVGAVLATGAAALAGLVVGVYVNKVLGFDPITYFYLQVSLIGLFPLVVAVAMLFGALARTVDVQELAVWFGADSVDRPHPRDALSRALGDPGLQVLYQTPPGSQHWVDHLGRRAAPPQPSIGLGVIPVGRGDDVVVTYDTVLQPDPAPVVAAVRVADLAIDHQRLAAELGAREIEVRESRRRIVTSAAEARQKLARDLHDGVQAHLLVAGLTAGRLALRAESAPVTASDLDHLRGDIERAATELRRVVEGVMPALLIEQGLFAASASYLPNLPLATRLTTDGDDSSLDVATVSAAYFVLAEAAANVLKHARATSLTVRMAVDEGRLRVEVNDDGIGGAGNGEVRPDDRRGSGLAGMHDRVVALGGTFHIESPPGAGTRVAAEFPCGS